MRYFVIILLCFNIFSLVSCQNKKQLILNSDEKEDTINEEYCMVDLRGEVMYPGIYKVLSGTLVDEVIRFAGGVTNNADLSNINLVSIITSNTKINVGSKQNDEKHRETLININTCTKEELLTIPKIGDAKATAIIEYRNVIGSYTKIEELLNVNGIGENLFEEIKAYITV